MKTEAANQRINVWRGIARTYYFGHRAEIDQSIADSKWLIAT